MSLQSLFESTGHLASHIIRLRRRPCRENLETHTSPRNRKVPGQLIVAVLSCFYHDSLTSPRTLSKCFLFFVRRICLWTIAVLAMSASRSPIGEPFDPSLLVRLPYFSQTGIDSSRSSRCSRVALTTSNSPLLPLIE